MGLQWCPNPDHYTDSKLASQMRNSIMHIATLRSANPTLLTSLVWCGRGLNPSLPRPKQTLYHETMLAVPKNKQQLGSTGSHWPTHVANPKLLLYWVIQQMFKQIKSSQLSPIYIVTSTCKRCKYCYIDPTESWQVLKRATLLIKGKQPHLYWSWTSGKGCRRDISTPG